MKIDIDEAAYVDAMNAMEEFNKAQEQRLNAWRAYQAGTVDFEEAQSAMSAEDDAKYRAKEAAFNAAEILYDAHCLKLLET